MKYPEWYANLYAKVNIFHPGAGRLMHDNVTEYQPITPFYEEERELTSMFPWGDTKQGHNYWADITAKILHKTVSTNHPKLAHARWLFNSRPGGAQQIRRAKMKQLITGEQDDQTEYQPT